MNSVVVQVKVVGMLPVQGIIPCTWQYPPRPCLSSWNEDPVDGRMSESPRESCSDQ